MQCSQALILVHCALLQNSHLVFTELQGYLVGQGCAATTRLGLQHLIGSVQTLLGLLGALLAPVHSMDASVAVT